MPRRHRLREQRRTSPAWCTAGRTRWNADWIGAHTWNAAASYVTGTHNMKFGYQGAYHVDNRAPGGNNLSFRVANGVPNQLTERIIDYRTLSRVRYYAFYAQDQWTRDRLTLQGAVRFDHPWSNYPEQSIGGVQFLPAVTTFPESRGVEGYNDITPRMGARLRPVRQREDGHQVQHGPVSRGGGQRQRQLLGAPAGVARAGQRDAHLDRRERQLRAGLRSEQRAGAGLRATGGDFCGQISQLAFGTKQPARSSTTPTIMQGWGVRPGDWQIGVTAPA